MQGRLSRVVLASLLSVLVLATSASVRAQATDTPSTTAATTDETSAAARDAEGRGLFEAGRAAFADGRYEDALGYFDRAYALSHRAELLYNIGSANDRMRRDAAALAAFEQYVSELPEAANRREVEARIRVLRESIAAQTVAPEGTETTIAPESESESPSSSSSLSSSLSSSPSPSPSPTTPSDGGPGVVGEWWFWTLIVAGVAGAVVAGVLIGTQSSGTTYPPYTTGDNGITFALTIATP